MTPKVGHRPTDPTQMLEIDRASSGLRRKTDRDLPETDLGRYTRAQLTFAVAAWPLRAAEERRSALIFRALMHAGRVAGIPEQWTRRFLSAARDEIGHAKLCAAIGARLGADRPRYDAGPVRIRLASLIDPVDRAAALLLVEVAMGETVSMSLFRAGRRAAVEPLTRAALASILSDEVRHQRIGWEGIVALWPSLSARQKEALQTQATLGLASFEQRIAVPALRRLEAGEPFDPAYAALGVLSPEARVEAFYQSIEHLVVPRLTRVGLQGKRAWDDRYRRSST